MKIPRKLNLLEQQWKVYRPDVDGAHGICLPAERRILIDRKLSADTAAETFLHELLHAINALSGCQLSDDEEEGQVSRIAPILFAVIRRNKLDFTS